MDRVAGGRAVRVLTAPRRNRVDPFGDLHAVPERGLFTGNRGCLVDDHERVVRHHASRAWITCLTEFRGWRVELARPRRWTPVFFLDDAVALAAGHRPCATCRRGAYTAYRDAVTAGVGAGEPLRAAELDTRLQRERLGPGRGLVRARDRLCWPAAAGDLPDGAVYVDGDTPCVVLRAEVWRFGFGGWVGRGPLPNGTVGVLTPPTSVLALRHGFTPTLHPSLDLTPR